MVSVLLGISVIIGVLAYSRYSFSEIYLHKAFDELAAKGATVDTEGCVSVVLDWHNRCEAMKSLCDHSIPMAMTHCLGQKNASPARTAERQAYCKSFVHPITMGRWTHEKCADIKVSKKAGSNRTQVKACSYAFRAIAQFCREGGRGVRLGLPSKRGW